jgi:hypothetical protein
MTAEPEYDLDLSWDETGEIAAGVEDGTYTVFCAKCAVFVDGEEIAADYLGQCIYADIMDFRDHVGCKATGCGSYFSDMVREAVSLARAELKRRADSPLYVRSAA